MTKLLLYINEAIAAKNLVSCELKWTSRKLSPPKPPRNFERVTNETRRNKTLSLIGKQIASNTFYKQSLFCIKKKTMIIIESFDFCHLHSLFKPNKCRTEFTKGRPLSHLAKLVNGIHAIAY